MNMLNAGYASCVSTYTLIRDVKKLSGNLVVAPAAVYS